MITGVHALLYAENPEAARAFFRDVLGFPFVESHPGWLIFALPPAELGIHPVEGEPGAGESGASGTHLLSLMCDDVHKTVEELTRKGVEFTQPITDQGWGILTTLKVPGGGEIGLYQPRHPLPPRQ